jgi:hypothetical protein
MKNMFIFYGECYLRSFEFLVIIYAELLFYVDINEKPGKVT